MIPQDVESVKEFIATHQVELQQEPVGITSLFSEYVVYCNGHGYDHHTNLVQFSREIKVD